MRRAAQASTVVFAVLAGAALFVASMAFQAGADVVFVAASVGVVVAMCGMALSVVALNAARQRDAERAVREWHDLSADTMIAYLRADQDRDDNPEATR